MLFGLFGVPLWGWIVLGLIVCGGTGGFLTYIWKVYSAVAVVVEDTTGVDLPDAPTSGAMSGIPTAANVAAWFPQISLWLKEQGLTTEQQQEPILGELQAKIAEAQKPEYAVSGSSSPVQPKVGP